MLQMTVGDLKAQFSMVLDEIKKGNDVEVLYGRSKKPVAVLTAPEKLKKKEPRKLGLYNHLCPKGGVKIEKISMEEFLGVNSLDEIKPVSFKKEAK